MSTINAELFPLKNYDEKGLGQGEDEDSLFNNYRQEIHTEFAGQLALCSNKRWYTTEIWGYDILIYAVYISPT